MPQMWQKILAEKSSKQNRRLKTQKGRESRSSHRELRQLNKSLRICHIRLTTSDIALRQLYLPNGKLRIYLI